LFTVAVESQVPHLNICFANVIWYCWDRDKTSDVNYYPSLLNQIFKYTLHISLNLFTSSSMC